MLTDGAEIVVDGPMSQRGRRMLTAMAGAAPAGTQVVSQYSGRRRVVMLYGAGLPSRLEVMNKHLAAGGRIVAWDLSYWNRTDTMRMSLDGLHPTAEHLALAPETGRRDEHRLREDADLDGPVLLIGIGDKSAAMLGLEPLAWERSALDVIRVRHPARRVLYRPKGKQRRALHGAGLSPDGSIEEALRGCSLVVCRHSNVAIDACIAGVPVECETGAAAALYATGAEPTREQRAEFLRRLGWWQWAPSEARACWTWIERITT